MLYILKVCLKVIPTLGLTLVLTVLTHFPFCVIKKSLSKWGLELDDYIDEDQTKDELPKVMTIDFFKKLDYILPRLWLIKKLFRWKAN
jgi:hypothetical protein